MTKKITPVIIGVIKNNNKFLLTKRREFTGKDKKYHDLWQFPGGGMQFGETPEQTLNRELMEELGIKVKNVKQFPRVLTEVRDNWQGLFIIFTCVMKNISDKIKLNNEASEFDWFTIEEIKKLPRLPLTYELVSRL